VTSEMIPLILLPPTDRRPAVFVGEEPRATWQASPPAPSAPPQAPPAPARLPAVDGPAAGPHQAEDDQEVQLDVEREAAVQSASSADDMLRALVASVRSGQPASVRLADLHGIAEHCALAFVIGLVNSLPGCLCEPDGETLRVVPSSPPRLTGRTATGQMRRYVVTDISGAYTAPTTMLILGDAVQVDISRAQPMESDKLTYYFAGLAAGLCVSLKAGRSVLTMG